MREAWNYFLRAVERYYGAAHAPRDMSVLEDIFVVQNDWDTVMDDLDTTVWEFDGC